MYCIECGKELQNDSKFCTVCGSNQIENNDVIANKTENKSNNISLKAILIIIAVGIWGIFLQNVGVIPTKRSVFVEGGNIEAFVQGGKIDASVEGTVDITNSVDVTGSIRVINEVDVNLASINGYQTKSYGNGHLGVTVN